MQEVLQMKKFDCLYCGAELASTQEMLIHKKKLNHYRFAYAINPNYILCFAGSETK